jgi:hypothetical protein
VQSQFKIPIHRKLPNWECDISKSVKGLLRSTPTKLLPSNRSLQQEDDTIERAEAREQPFLTNPIYPYDRRRALAMQPSGIDMPSSVLTLLDRQRLLYRAMTNKAPQVADEGTERARPISPRIKQEVDLDPVYSKGSDTRSPASTLLDRKRVLYLTKRNRASQTTVEEEEGPRHKSPRLNDASGSLSIDQRSMPKLRRTGKTWLWRKPRATRQYKDVAMKYPENSAPA